MTDLDSLIRAADPAARLTAPAPPPLREPARREARWLPVVAAAAAVAAVVGLAVATTGPGGGPDPTGTPAATAPTSPVTRDWDQLRAALVRNLPRDLTGSSIRELTPPPAPRGTTVRGVAAEVHVGARIGTVTATVWTGLPIGDPCRISARLTMDGNCRPVRTAAGLTVAVTDPDPAFGWPGITDHWALYQAPDGVVVLIAQGVGVERGGRPRLEHLPWPPARLAEVATDPAFRR